MAALREIFETRLAAIDEATRLHQKATDELPEMLERRLKQSANVLDARFAAINEFFSQTSGVRRRDTSPDGTYDRHAADASGREAQQHPLENR